MGYDISKVWLSAGEKTLPEKCSDGPPAPTAESLFCFAAMCKLADFYASNPDELLFALGRMDGLMCRRPRTTSLAYAEGYYMAGYPVELDELVDFITNFMSGLEDK